MSDAIDRAAEVLNQEVVRQSVNDAISITVHSNSIAFEAGLARALDEAGLLASGERDGAEQRLSEFLCEMTGGLLSKTGYEAITRLIRERSCPDCPGGWRPTPGLPRDLDQTTREKR